MTRPASLRRAALVATAVVALARCDWDGTRIQQNLPAAIALVSGAGQTGTVAQALALPLVVRVTNARGEGVGDVVVSWAVLGGGGAVTASATSTDTTGETSVIWTLGAVAGTHNHAVAATVNGLRVPPVTFIASADPGAPSRLAMISGNTQTGTVGQALPQPLVVTVQDQYLNGVGDVAVTWAVAAGDGSVSSTSVTTDAAGTASVGWTIGTAAGTDKDTATAAVYGLTGSPVRFTATANPGPPSRLVVISGNGQTGTVGQALPQSLVVAVQDQYLNGVRDVAVAWAVAAGGGSLSSGSVATDATGLASVTWTLGTVAGTTNHSVGATVSGVTGPPVTFTATANPGPPSRLVAISGNTQTGTVGQALPQPLVVAVHDQYVNLLPDVIVTWAVTSGGGSVSSSSVTTDADGQASVAWTLGTVAGANGHTATASVSGLAGSTVTFAATADPGPPSRLVAISGDGQSGAVGQQLGQPLVVAVQDQYLNLVRNVAVTWAVTSGGGSVSSTSVATDAAGRASVTWTIGTVAGAGNHAAATVSGLTGSPVTFTATGHPGPPGRLVVIGGNGQTGTVGQQLGQPLVVAAQDQYFNLLRDVAVTWTVTSGGGSVSSTSVATDAIGQASVTWTLGTVAGTTSHAVAATVGGGTVPPVTFTATANPGPPIRLVTISGNGQAGTVGRALAEPLVVAVQDQYLNGVQDVAVTWAVAAGAGSVSSTSGATDAGGRASVTWILGTVAGTNNHTAAATVSGLTGSPVTFRAVANPAPPSHLVVISGNGQTGAVGQQLGQPLVVAVHDQYLNPLRDVAVAWAVTSGGGSVSSTSVTTDATGEASVTWTLGTVAGTTNHTVAVTVGGLTGPPVTFTATANPGPPNRLVAISGNAQTGAVGQQLGQPLVVAVQDQYVNLLGNVVVTWAVTSGGGSVSSSSVRTGASGQSSVMWTLGTVAGANNHTVAATVSGLTGSPVTFAATANPGPPSRLVVISGNEQTGAVGQALPEPLVVAVRDQYLNGVRDVAVTWAVAAGGGSVSSTSVATDAAGRAAVTWTIGTVAGASNRTAATVSGLSGSPVTFTATGNPGPPSRLVVISGNEQTGAVGKQLGDPLVVVVQDQYLNLLEDVAVTWAVTSGGGSVSSTSVTTRANGQASVTWTLGTVAGANNHTVAATVGGGTAPPVTFTATATPGPASRLVVISGNGQTGAVGQALPQPLVVAAQDQYLNGVRDVAVTWAVAAGGGSVSSNSVTTDATGQASVAWTLGPVAGTGNHTAAATVKGLTGSPVTFAATANPGPPSRLVVISGNGQTGAVGQQLGQPLAVAVQDQYLNGVRDVAVTWAVAGGGGSVSSSSVTTDATGRASVTWTLGTVAGTTNQTVAATASGLIGSPVTFTATGNPGPPSRLVAISGNGQTGAVGQPLGQPLVVAVQDQYLNPLRDVAVTWAVTSGAGSISSISVTTDANGQASVAWTLGTVAGANNHTAAATVSGLTGSPVTFTATAHPGPASRLVVISGNGQTGAVGLALPQPLVVAVRDQYLNGVGDVAVTWAVAAGSGSVSSSSVTTDATGQASVGWTLGTVAGAGNHTAAATVSGLAGSPVTFTATANPGPPSRLVAISGNAQTGTVGQQLGQPLVVAVQDQYLNGVRDVAVTWAVAAAGGSVSSTSVATDAAGRASITWTLGTLAGTNNHAAAATVSGLAGSPVTFTATANPAPPSRLVVISGNGQTGAVRQALSQPLVVAVQDQYLNGVRDVAVAWAVTSGGGSVSSGSVTTDATGQTSVSWTLGAVAGTDNQAAAATVNGLAGSPVAFTATANPGPPSRLVVISGNGQTGAVGQQLGQPLVVAVQDQYLNGVRDVAVSWAVAGGGGSVSSSSVTTDATGQASVTWILGTVAGTDNQAAAATVNGLSGSPVAFTATANPGLPSRLVAISGNAQTGAVGQPLGQPLVVAVQDQYLNLLRDVVVTWAVTSGGGSVSSSSVTTDATGQASVTWRLGTVAGTNNHTAAATVSGLAGSPVTFAATADPGPPSRLVAISGDGQSGAVGQQLGQPLVVAVQDQYLNLLRNVAVNWAVTSGGGSVSSTSIATDAAGRASVTWILGTVAGTSNHTAAATVSGLTGSPVTFAATANPGPPSRLIAISGNAQTGTVGQALPDPLVVAVQDQYLNVVRDLAVTWAVTSGGGSVASTSVTTDATGQASVTWTLGTLAGANNHTAAATVSGLSGSPVTFAATAHPGPPNRVVAFSGDGQSGAVGQQLGQPLVVAVQDQYLNGVRDVAVTWAVAAAAGSVSSTSVATDAAGRASVTWTLGTVAGTNNHTAAATVNGLAGSPVTFAATANPGPPSRLVAISGNAQAGTVGQPLGQPLVVAVQDQYLNGVRDVAVTWAVAAAAGSVSSTSVATDAGGRASVTWTLGTVAGTNSHTAAATVSGLSGSPVTFAATANPGPPSRLVVISGNAQTGVMGQQLGQALVVAVQDQYANLLPDVSVAWAVTSGGGSVSSSSVTTDATGQASVTWTLGTVVGANGHTATATVSGLTGLLVTFTATANSGPPSRLVVISGDGQAGTVGQALSQPLVVAVQDQNLNGVRDVVVTWAVAAGGGSVSSSSVLTDAAGRAAVTWTIGTVAGTDRDTARATVAGLTGSPLTFTARGTPGPPARLLMVSGDGERTQVAQPVSLVVAVRDQYDNRVSGVAVGWAVVTGGGSVSAASVPTGADGSASVTWTLGTTAGIHTSQATLAGVSGSPVTFTATATPGPPARLAIAGGNGQTAPAATALPLPLSARVTDAYGNGLSEITVAWSVTTGAGTLSTAASQTGPDGTAASHWTLGRFAGRQTASASAGTLQDSPSTFSATATPNATVSGTITLSGQYLAPPQIVTTVATNDARSAAQLFVGSKETPAARLLAEYVPDELIVTFRAQALGAPPVGSPARAAPAAVRAVARDIRARLSVPEAAGELRTRGVSPLILAARVQVTDPARLDAVAERLRRDPSVAAVERNGLVYGDRSGSTPVVVATAPSDSFAPDQAWHYGMMDLPQAWDITRGSASVLVAVIDDGIRFDHPDIAANLTSDGYDFVSEDLAPRCGGGGLVSVTGDGDGYDRDPTVPVLYERTFMGCVGVALADGGHGLHVAGTIGAVGDNGVGVSGVNWTVRIRPIRALSSIGSGREYDVAQAILYAAGLPADNGADSTVAPAGAARVINMSLGSTGSSQVMHDAIIQATAAGVLVVAAAGNGSTAAPSYPAAYDEVLSVSSVGPDALLASYSSYGSTVDIAAPGGDLEDGGCTFAVTSTWWNFAGNAPAYACIHGTSMASPHVVGVAALVLAQNPGLTAAQLRSRLTTWAVDVGSVGRDDRYGAGIVNARNSLTQSFAPPRQLYARLYDAVSGAAVRTSIAQPDGSYVFTAVPDGAYYVYAGQDENGDQRIGEPGRPWGAYGGSAVPGSVGVSGAGPYPASFTIGFPKESEPNGTPDVANALPIGGYLTGNTSPSGADYARVQVAEPGVYTFETVPVDGACGFALEENTILDLFDAGGNPLATNDDISAATYNYCSRISMSLAAGTHYLRVRGIFGGRFAVKARSGT